MEKVTKARQIIDDLVKENRVVYGITTGFGKFARTVIDKGPYIYYVHTGRRGLPK